MAHSAPPRGPELPSQGRGFVLVPSAEDLQPPPPRTAGESGNGSKGKQRATGKGAVNIQKGVLGRNQAGFDLKVQGKEIPRRLARAHRHAQGKRK